MLFTFSHSSNVARSNRDNQIVWHGYSSSQCYFVNSQLKLGSCLDPSRLVSIHRLAHSAPLTTPRLLVHPWWGLFRRFAPGTAASIVRHCGSRRGSAISGRKMESMCLSTYMDSGSHAQSRSGRTISRTANPPGPAVYRTSHVSASPGRSVRGEISS